LYRPLATNDRQQNKMKIVSIQGYLYSKIGVVVLIAGAYFNAVFPYFFF
jgi:hypothetical protein